MPIAAADRLTTAMFQEFADFVSCEAEEPAPERPAARIILPALHRSGDGKEDLLGQVGGISILQAALASEAVDQPAVQLDELTPGRAIVPIAQTSQQTCPRKKGVSHGTDLGPLPEYRCYRRTCAGEH
jgi:hypothetical protein